LKTDTERADIAYING